MLNLNQLMMRTICLMIVILTSSIVYGQGNKKIEVEEMVFTEVHETATPKMTLKEYYKHLATFISYPEKAKKKGIEGKVYVEFVIDKKGKVTNAKVVKGIGGGCDKIALNAVINAGDWTPGLVSNKPVKQKLILPITFSID